MSQTSVETQRSVRKQRTVVTQSSIMRQILLGTQRFIMRQSSFVQLHTEVAGRILEDEGPKGTKHLKLCC